MSGHWAGFPITGNSAEMVTYQNAADIQDNQHRDRSVASDSAASVPCCTAPHYPAHFRKGSIIQLASGDLKRIEDLTTEDFVRSAEISKDLCIDTSVVCGITPLAGSGTVMLQFSVGQKQVQVSTTLYTVCLRLLCMRHLCCQPYFTFLKLLVLY